MTLYRVLQGLIVLPFSFRTQFSYKVEEHFVYHRTVSLLLVKGFTLSVARANQQNNLFDCLLKWFCVSLETGLAVSCLLEPSRTGMLAGMVLWRDSLSPSPSSASCHRDS